MNGTKKTYDRNTREVKGRIYNANDVSKRVTSANDVRQKVTGAKQTSRPRNRATLIYTCFI